MTRTIPLEVAISDKQWLGKRIKWHHCACGESVCVPSGDSGRGMLAEWRKFHTAHVGEHYDTCPNHTEKD